MTRFYIISSALALGLIASPLLLLRGEFRRKAHTGSVYRSVYESAVKSIDPATCGDVTSSSIQANFYEGLYTYHYLKRPLEVVAQLADSLPVVSDDGLTYTIHLKRGVLYHRNPCFGADPTGGHKWNRREMEARDFVLAIKRVADYHINTGLAWAFLADRIVGLDEYREKTKQHKIGDYNRYDLDVEGVQAVDRHTLRLRLTSPFPQLIYVLAMQVYAPIPREIIDYWLSTRSDRRGGRAPIPVHERNPEILEQEQVVGTGPYLLTTWKRKHRIELRRNPEFREEYYPNEGEGPSEEYPGDSAAGLLADAGKRVPFIDELHFQYMEEEYASWMMFLSKETDVTGIPNETFESVISRGRELGQDWQQRGIFLSRTAYPAIYWIAFNMEDKVLGSSKALRQAICLAYDVENEIKIISNGRGHRAVNILPSSFKGFQEAGPGPYYRHDPEAARVKLDEAKRQLSQSGLLQAGQIPELVLDLSDGPNSLRLADFTRQQFAKIGLKLKIVFNDWPTLQRKVNNKQAQMYMMGWHADYPDAENFLQLFYSGNIDKGTNNSNYADPVFDSLYESIRVMPDTPERTQVYAKMIGILNEDCPILLLYEPESYTLFNEWVLNVKQHPIGYGYVKYRRINEDKRRTLPRGRTEK